eukprot:1249597-Prymnesium_polylepis.1
MHHTVVWLAFSTHRPQFIRSISNTVCSWPTVHTQSAVRDYTKFQAVLLAWPCAPHEVSGRAGPAPKMGSEISSHIDAFLVASAMPAASAILCR